MFRSTWQVCSSSFLEVLEFSSLEMAGQCAWARACVCVPREGRLQGSGRCSFVSCCYVCSDGLQSTRSYFALEEGACVTQI